MTKTPLIFGRSGKPLHFLHANGFPPEAYRAFLSPFTTGYQVVASYLRPLWPEVDFERFLDWTFFRDDLLNFFDHLHAYTQLERETWQGPAKVIGVGHSLGATVSLMAALQRPDLFKALVLIEPVLFPPWQSLLLEKTSGWGLLERFHPLIRRTRRRKNHFSSRRTMYENYREKAVFSELSDRVLRDYVDGLAAEERDGVRLAYPPIWEARIYATAGSYGRQIWQRLDGLKPPVLVIRGETSDTLGRRAVSLFQNKLPEARVQELSGLGHLAPLEAPELVARQVVTFLEDVEQGRKAGQVQSGAGL